MSAANDLIAFLHPSVIEREWKDWQTDVPIGFLEIIDFDKHNGEIKGWAYDSLKQAPVQEEYIFDNYILKLLKDLISSVVVEIRERKLNTEISLSDNEFDKSILRLKKELNTKYDQLQDRGIPITTSLVQLERFTNINLTNQLIKNRNGKRKIEPNLSGSKVVVQGADADFVGQLCGWLVQHSKIDNKDESLFISFFEGKWNGNSTISWKGTPQEFVMFYYSLYNKIDILDPSSNIILRPKRSYNYLLSFIMVNAEGERLYSIPKRFNSNTKQGSFYKSIVSKICSLT